MKYQVVWQPRETPTCSYLEFSERSERPSPRLLTRLIACWQLIRMTLANRAQKIRELSSSNRWPCIFASKKQNMSYALGVFYNSANVIERGVG